MSKYEHLWKWIRDNGTDSFKLTYAEIEEITGVPIDHSFLKYKKELLEYGFCVGKISMKEETVMFQRVIRYDRRNYCPKNEYCHRVWSEI